MAVSTQKMTVPDVLYEQADSPVQAGFADAGGFFDQETLAAQFGVTQRDIAETAGLSASATYRKSRMASASAQARLMEMSEILRRVTVWAGGGRQAFAWYRAEPIPAFGNRTAESIVKGGHATALRDYLDHLALGGFA